MPKEKTYIRNPEKANRRQRNFENIVNENNLIKKRITLD
jgi:hypothetical protein